MKDISFFIQTFIRSNTSSRKAFKAFFEELLNVWDASQPSENHNSASSSSLTSVHEIQIDVRDESSPTILAFVDDEKKNLYFLFPTKASENHNILLHFKDKVNCPSTFLYEKKLEESFLREKEPKIKAKKKNKKRL